MTRLLQDVAYAVRTFAKAPGFTAIAVFVLVVGVGANLTIFSIVNEFLLRPLSGGADELVGLYSRDRTQARSFRAFSYSNYVDIREQSEVFDGLIAHRFAMVGTSEGDETRRALAALVSSNYFDTLGVRLAAGRSFTAEEERPGWGAPVAIATYAQWQKEQLDPRSLARRSGSTRGISPSSGLLPMDSPGRWRWYRLKCICRSARSTAWRSNGRRLVAGASAIEPTTLFRWRDA